MTYDVNEVVKTFFVKLQEQLLTIVLWKICPENFSKIHRKAPILESRFFYATPAVDCFSQETNIKTRVKYKYLE